MQGSGKTYDYSGDTTEWEDILIKKGITTKDSVLLSKGLNPLDVSVISIIFNVYMKKYWYINIIYLWISL